MANGQWSTVNLPSSETGDPYEQQAPEREALANLPGGHQKKAYEWKRNVMEKVYTHSLKIRGGYRITNDD